MEKHAMTDEDQSPELLTRREAIRRVSTMLGGALLIGQTAMLSANAQTDSGGAMSDENTLFTDDDVALLDEIAETILPETDTPGAKAAGVGAFMALMVTDTYDPQDQQIFKAGMAKLNELSRDLSDHDFMAAAAEDRHDLLQTLDAEQLDYMETKSDDEPAHFFRMMKELTLLGYFTSEIGCTKAMRYVETPGRYDPCAPHEPGDKAWAQHA